jgi:hypothetical protein
LYWLYLICRQTEGQKFAGKLDTFGVVPIRAIPPELIVGPEFQLVNFDRRERKRAKLLESRWTLHWEGHSSDIAYGESRGRELKPYAA